ncbi:MAG: oxidoreductase [Flavobacterium sp. BFFFF1]|uniref:SDR family NAD(P)-dependent oxidoreductase n=1 Tax=Flavobacterium sp. BFFFF1 TaxID=2015557 RepID=UPI000BD39AA6|nr:SDR family oxidoreductase [Flavobacterium sp. BFFFF1]OYU81864.1 MAG: oxidoreductase [Flavobacterium sp. BFFFF1]
MDKKTYIIAGASSGIGSELAKILTDLGNNIVALSRSAGNLGGLQNCRFIPYDFTSGDALPEVTGPVNGIIYCPGSINLKPFQRFTEQDFAADFQLNVLGAVRLIKGYLPNLKQAENPGIVLFSSVAVGTGMSFHSSIAASKAAVEGLTRSLAAELAPVIRVNCIAPSLTDTPLAGQLLNSEAKREANADKHPLKQIGQPEDIAAMAAYLLSDQAKWITGQVIGINGGMGTLMRN